MARKPKGDLGSMAISKAKASGTVPFGEAASSPQAATAAPKSLTVKLDGETYAGLRAYCYEKERETGTRLTHQQVMVRALKGFLSSGA